MIFYEDSFPARDLAILSSKPDIGSSSGNALLISPLSLPFLSSTTFTISDIPTTEPTLASQHNNPSPPLLASAEFTQPSHPMITQAQAGTSRPKSFLGYQLYYSSKHPIMAFHTPLLPTEPNTFKQVSKFFEWLDAMKFEFTALQANKTWTLCPRPSTQHVLNYKWVFKIKQKSNGSLDRYKVRLVAKRYEQQDGIDYTETFSPVIKPATIRVVLTLAVHHQWPICQLDVSNAFLHHQLNEEVFMEHPQGFVNNNFLDHVCKLQKSIYGLKQAYRAWFNKLSQALTTLGFNESQVDHSLFTFHFNSIHIFVLVYVDDIIIIGTNLNHI